MGLKEKMLERIEKNSIKVNVDGEKVYLKKGGFFEEWRVIYPPVNPETGKWDKINLFFGGKGNAFTTFLVGVIILALGFGAWEIIHSYNVTFSNQVVQQCLKQAGIVLRG